MAEGLRSLWMASRYSDVHTTLVSALRSDAYPRARRRKETTYPRVVGRHAMARLVVMGVEWVAGSPPRLHLERATAHFFSSPFMCTPWLKVKKNLCVSFMAVRLNLSLRLSQA